MQGRSIADIASSTNNIAAQPAATSSEEKKLVEGLGGR